MYSILQSTPFAFFLALVTITYSSSVVHVGIINDAPQSLMIDGPAESCLGTTASYTVSNSSFTTGFNWTLPPSWTLLSGGGTKTISVRFNSPGMGYNLSVTHTSASGNKIVGIYQPPGGTPIMNGPSTVC